MAQFTIELKGLHLFGRHGLYPEETVAGGEFELNIALRYKVPEKEPLGLEDTIDYAAVYALVKERFAQPTGLLENLARELAAAIQAAFPQTEDLSISIVKLHPPIPGFEGAVGVKLVVDCSAERNEK